MLKKGREVVLMMIDESPTQIYVIYITLGIAYGADTKRKRKRKNWTEKINKIIILSRKTHDDWRCIRTAPFFVFFSFVISK